MTDKSKGASMLLQHWLRLFTLLCRCTCFNSWFLKGCSCCKAIHRQNNRWSNVFCRRRHREWRLCVWKSLVCLCTRSCCPHTQWRMATDRWWSCWSLGLYSLKCPYLLTSPDDQPGHVRQIFRNHTRAQVGLGRRGINCSGTMEKKKRCVLRQLLWIIH